MILTLAAGVLGVCSCRGPQSASTNGESYRTIKVHLSDQTLQTGYSASIEGRQDIDIYPQVSGTLTKVCINEGETVRKGQLLFVIDQVPYEAELRTAQANVTAAEASVATAQLAYDSKQDLYDQKIVSEYELKTAYNSLSSAKASLAQMQAEEVNARNSLSYTEVRSPSNGVAGTLPYRQGTLVSSSLSQPLTTISDNSAMYVYFSMNEKQLLSLIRTYGSLGKSLEKMPDVGLKLSDGSFYSQTGRIESISGVVDKETGSASLRAVFPNGDRLLLSGTSGTVLIPSTYKDCIVIPQVATYEVQDQVYVYKVVDGVTKSTRIQVSESSNGTDYIVTDGLQEGDEIIADGAGLLRDGMHVKSMPAAGNGK